MQDDTEVTPHATPSRQKPKTRTLAIIKPHALKHRVTIEPRLTEAGFDIIKERMMQFDSDSDMDYLNELFGEDSLTLIGAPIWVYVLERHRAVEVWNALMGHTDPAIAKESAPNSLRAIYGLSVQENAVAGPPDNETAENQIAALFASSPPFGPDESRQNSLRSVASSLLLQLKEATAAEDGGTGSGSDGGYTRSAASTAGKLQAKKPQNGNGKPAFKARPAPSTTRKPESQPRTTKAAALRAGIPINALARTPSGSGTLAGKKTFENVPGHKRTEPIKVASTATPAIVPRLTKAASLRMGITPAAKPRGPPSAKPIGKGNGTIKAAKTSPTNNATFEGVPGHKRRETISVMSTKEPTVAPRQNRSALLRQQKESSGPPTSYMFKAPVEKPRPQSVTGMNEDRKQEAEANVAQRRQSVSVASIRAPTIPPRTNRSALLRSLSQGS